MALGDMLELGDLAESMHQGAVRDIFRTRPDACVVVGPEMAAALDAVVRDGDLLPRPALLERCADSRAAATIVRRLVRPGDVLLVKGSRGIAMERIIESLEVPTSQ
jgi:UDP-N-acetylmuramoyl-tripeptide--D-alanyl-D-alanine ligase